MSWDEHDLLGDLEEETPHEFFYTDFIKKPNEYVNDDFADEYAETDPEEEYIDDILEDYLSVDDIDFSNLDGVDLKEDFKRIAEEISGRRVLGRDYEEYSDFGRHTSRLSRQSKPQVKTVERPIARKPLPRPMERPIARKPLPRPMERPIVRKPLPRPMERPIVKKPLIKNIQEQRPITPRPTSRPNPDAKPPLRANPERSQPQQPRPRVTAKGTVQRNRTNDKNCNTTKRIIVPEDRKVIVEGVDKFILSNTKESNSIKNIGYYKGEKCSELILIINNTTPNDFEFELFNPSMPLDYLFSSSQDLNARILVAGDNKVSYSDVLFNLLANPTILPNAKFVVTNPDNQTQKNLQFNQSLIFKNKNIAGQEIINPVANALNIDVDQTQNEIIYWNIQQSLGRVYIPDGMDVISYKVLAGNTVTFAFYYKQISLKKFFFKEARSKTIL